MIDGIYEQLITKLISEKISKLDSNQFFIKKQIIDKAEASIFLSQHISTAIKFVLDKIKGENQIQLQIEIVNKIIRLLQQELENSELDEELVVSEGQILRAIFSKLDSNFSDLDLHLNEIFPSSRLVHSELFTGGNVGLSLESELKKEILSSNEINLLISFIKFKGVIILLDELRKFSDNGGKLRVLTTTYMGASDYKAIKLLSEIKNSEVKISYNSGNERLHAKAYLFRRNTGFHTGYIGSSNWSRSALTDGLEWNLKITTKETSHIIEKFQKTFDSYWNSNDFEHFDQKKHSEKLKKSLDQGKISKGNNINTTSFFDLKPYPFQNEILEKLEVERKIHQRTRNLVVAATGTGKTIISAFDFKRFKSENENSKLLFLAHRKEILKQALGTYRGVLKDNNFGELWVDGIVPDNKSVVFASVQTLKNRVTELNLSKKFFNFIVIDECHHQKANSYRKIIDFFEPQILLGLTATPERMDGGDIKEDFHNKIAAEIRLPEALNRKLLSPFQYFGISDSIDLSNARWEKGKYVPSELTKIYTSNDRRVNEIISAIDKYTKDYNESRSLGFCATIEHAKYMTEKFKLAGLKAAYLTSENSNHRDLIRNKLKTKEINFLFVVDIFNEGVDIPEIDTVLFLRPTESLTIFLQQLGRGLRLAEGKECLTVLDFVGNARAEYDFENKFRAIIGKTTTSIKKEIENNFPHLPLGCSIILEKKAKEVILKNIKNATTLSTSTITEKIKQFENQTFLELSLSNFLEFYHIPIQYIYKRNSWKRLCNFAGKIQDFPSNYDSYLISTLRNKWLSCNSLSYFKFILRLANKNFNIALETLSKTEKTMCLMLHYDFWQTAGGFENLGESIKEIGKNKIIVDEIIEFLEYRIDQIDFKEIDVKLPYSQPLKIHSRYTRDQILVAFGLSTFEKKSSNREGVAKSKILNTELLFINLVKSEEDFSPTTMYDDYAVNEKIFHWQSQNSAGPNTPKGVSYIKHKSKGKKILLFVRERNKDEYGSTMGYVFIGEGSIMNFSGSKPMNIEWELNEPMPNFLWKDAAKLLAG